MLYICCYKYVNYEKIIGYILCYFGIHKFNKDKWYERTRWKTAIREVNHCERCTFEIYRDVDNFS